MKRFVPVFAFICLLSTLPPLRVPASATAGVGSDRLVFEQLVPKGDDPWDRQWDVYTGTVEGATHRNLTQSTVIHETSPVWSPDGRFVAYVRSPDAAVVNEDTAPLVSERSSVVVAAATGDGVRVLVRSDEDTGVVSSLDWSPDGTHLVYTRNWFDYSRNWYTGGFFVKGRLEAIRLRDGRVRTLYVQRGGVFHWPQWSPDGSNILVERYLDGYPRPGGFSMVMVGVDGTLVDLASRGIYGWWPSWTPAGHILHTRPGSSILACRSPCADVWVSDVSGRPLRKLTNAPHDLGGDGWNDHLWRPRLSPDGNSLAIIVRRDYEDPRDRLRMPQYQLWVSDLPSQTWQRVADHGPPANVEGDAPGGNLLSLDWRPECTISGTPGRDLLVGTGGRDLICGLGDDDTIYGLGGDDVIFGHGGDDQIVGGAGADIVVGNGGRDRCDRHETDYSRVC